uniref:glucuronosyltransferase n=1 Tax=Parascaris equorum TaxID=6256 RepID=A0A914R2D0_PAREQ
MKVSFVKLGHIDAFITHAGLNSLSEAIFAGVPVISIPLFGDQLYNAEIKLFHNYAGMVPIWLFIRIKALPFFRSIMLFFFSYSIKSKELSLMLEKKPMKPSEMFLKYVEFAAEFKSVGEYLQLQSVNLNDIQLYSLDVIVPFLFCLLLFYYLSFLIAMRLFRCLRASFKTKRD